MPATLARMVDGIGHAVLATCRGGLPYTSLVAVARVPDTCRILFATARKTRKHTNLTANPGVCLMIDSRTCSAGDYLSAESLSVEGRAICLRRGRRRDDTARILSLRHRKLRGFFSDRATVLVVVTPVRMVHVSDFQRVTVWQG